jgi:hypothetical protein
MALLKPTVRRLDIPGEPGQWVEIRRLSSLGGLDTDEMGKGRTRRLLEMARYFASAIVAWSYPEPVTIDVIAGAPNAGGDREGGLDSATALWLLGEIGKLASGDRSDEQLFPSSSPSIAA